MKKKIADPQKTQNTVNPKGPEKNLNRKQEADVFHDLNEKSFSSNFTLLIQHYKKQVAQHQAQTKIL